MEVHSLSHARKILFFLFFHSNGVSVFLHCFCLFEMITKFFIHHISDIEWHPAIFHHMAHFLAFITFDWWSSFLGPIYIHCIGIFLSWSVVLMGRCHRSSCLVPVLVTTLSIIVVWCSGVVPYSGGSCLIQGGFPTQSTLISFAIESLFSFRDSPLPVNCDGFIVPFLDSDRLWPYLW